MGQILAQDDFTSGGFGIDLAAAAHHLNTNTNWKWKNQNAITTRALTLTNGGLGSTYAVPAVSGGFTVGVDFIWCPYDSAASPAQAYLIWDYPTLGISCPVYGGNPAPGQAIGVVGRFNNQIQRGYLSGGSPTAPRAPSYYAAYVAPRSDNTGYEVHLKCVVAGVTIYDMVAQMISQISGAQFDLRFEINDLEKSVWYAGAKVLSAFDNYVSAPGGAGLWLNGLAAVTPSQFGGTVLAGNNFQIDTFIDVTKDLIPVVVNPGQQTTKAVGNGFIDTQLLNFEQVYQFVYNLPTNFIDTPLAFAKLEVQNILNLGAVKVQYGSRVVTCPPKSTVLVDIVQGQGNQIVLTGAAGVVPIIFYAGVDIGYQLITGSN